MMPKLPPLSVLLPPREPFTFHSAAESYNYSQQQQHTCCSVPAAPQHYSQHYPQQQQQQQMHYHQQQHQPMHYEQQQPMHYQQQQPQQFAEHYNNNNCYAQQHAASSAPTSPSSPTWWQQPRPTMLPVSNGCGRSAPFWKNTRGLGDAVQRLRELPTSLSSSSLSSMASSSTSSSPASSPSKVPAATVVRPKKSRYLREMDRRAIIKRLDNGEKQCALAKEFSVSRSSICNLFKHRDEVLSRAAHQSPFSKHPKKCKKQQSQPPRRFA